MFNSHFSRSLTVRVALGILAFTVLSLCICLRPAWKLTDFDQNFYTKLAYDLDRYGVFSSGALAEIDGTTGPPAPGMFFGPIYPALVLATMKADARFGEAVRCSIEADRGDRDQNTCESYLLPIRLIHALLLTIAVLAIAGAAEVIFPQSGVFVLSAVLATGALAFESNIFSYIMTESTIIALYSLFALLMVVAWRYGRWRDFAAGGFLLGLLSLTKPSFALLFPIIALFSLLCDLRLAKRGQASAASHLLALGLAFAAVVGGWALRNAVSVGKIGLTEEYGAAALIERFAYDDMTMREFVQAFPYCTPGLGEIAFDLVYGRDSMHRFMFHTADSFFHKGRGRREQLLEANGRLDPVIGGIVRDELRQKGWRYVLTSIPLAWCGMWPGWIVTLLLLPLFPWSCWLAFRQEKPLFLLYAGPAVAMLALHAAVGNHYTRYNLILIGPYAVGAAWVIASWLPTMHWRWRFP